MGIVRASVALSEQVAVLLSRYEVDEAQLFVESEEARLLPAAMRD
eukprot:gene899-4922_t